MANLANRLEKLEKRITGPRGQPSNYVLLSGGGQSDDEIDIFLSERGYQNNDDMQVIILCGVEAGPNGLVTSSAPLKFISSNADPQHG